MQIETLRDLYHCRDHTQPHLMKGPLQLVIHVVQNRHFGEQATHWDKTNKELTSFKMVISFICLLPLHLLLSSKPVLYHSNDWMQGPITKYLTKVEN